VALLDRTRGDGMPRTATEVHPNPQPWHVGPRTGTHSRTAPARSWTHEAEHIELTQALGNLRDPTQPVDRDVVAHGVFGGTRPSSSGEIDFAHAPADSTLVGRGSSTAAGPSRFASLAASMLAAPNPVTVVSLVTLSACADWWRRAWYRSHDDLRPGGVNRAVWTAIWCSAVPLSFTAAGDLSQSGALSELP